jgi:integrase
LGESEADVERWSFESPTDSRSTLSGFHGRFDRKQQYYNRDSPDDQIPTITLHGLRHTWATLALSAGIDIKIVSERLNHSSTHITREIYTHVTPPMQSDAAERVARLIRGSRSTAPTGSC